MIPFLFIAGVVFGYFLVMPAAVRFLQNFNADEFNILVQARDYYRFTAITLLAVGLVFQIPVGILALTRLGVVSVEQLRRNRRYAILALAVVAMLLPGTDPITMLIMLVPLLLLYEASILLARVFGGPGRAPADPDEPETASS
jgi:sec-independent protein translocase protein TatC